MANANTDTTNKTTGANSEYKNRVLNGEHPIEKMAQNAGERVGAAATDFAKTAADSMKSSREYVIDNPVKGVAYAAAAGLVAGSLLTMVLRRRRE